MRNIETHLDSAGKKEAPESLNGRCFFILSVSNPSMPPSGYIIAQATRHVKVFWPAGHIAVLERNADFYWTPPLLAFYLAPFYFVSFAL
jgi:hypothetical protein